MDHCCNLSQGGLGCMCWKDVEIATLRAEKAILQKRNDDLIIAISMIKGISNEALK